MRKEALPLKHISPPYVFSPLHQPAGLCSGEALAPGSRSTELSFKKEGHYEKGFFLLFLLPLLLLATTFLIGTLKVISISQQRIAMQARLDVCALKLVQSRRSLAVELGRANRILHATKMGVYMARGLQVVGGPFGKLLGTAGEQTLLRANQATAQWQKVRTLYFRAQELRLSHCDQNQFSKSLALCHIQPALGQALEREPTLFPDLHGSLRFRSAPLARARCRGLGNMETIIRLDGDPALLVDSFSDTYEK